jgi:hypothetical protein
MIARVDNIDGELIGIHRTFFAPGRQRQSQHRAPKGNARLRCRWRGAAGAGSRRVNDGLRGGVCVRSGIQGARGAP